MSRLTNFLVAIGRPLNVAFCKLLDLSFEENSVDGDLQKQVEDEIMLTGTYSFFQKLSKANLKSHATEMAIPIKKDVTEQKQFVEQ